jgi:hypothetical protein
MKKPPRKNIFSYLLPYLFLALIIYSLFYLGSKNGFNFGVSEPLKLKLFESKVEILFQDAETWKEFPKTNVGSMKVLAGEMIKTDKNGLGKIFFGKGSSMFFDNKTSFLIKENQNSDSYQYTKINLNKGRVLVSLERMINPNSKFVLNLGNLDFVSQNGVFLIDEDSLEVLEGMVNLKKKNGDIVIDEKTIELGQKISFSQEINQKLPEKTVLDNDVYLSDFVVKALGENSNNKNNENKNKEEDLKDETQDSKENNEEEKTNEEEEKSSQNQEKQVKITEIPDPLKEEPLELKGTISTGEAEKVTVNGYELTKFKKGDTEFLYRAKKEWGNLKEGKNTYEIKIIFTDEEELTKEVLVNYQPEIKVEPEEDNKKVEPEEIEENNETENVENSEEPENTEDLEKISLSVISPEKDEKISDDPVLIKGTAPLNASKIKINDYFLKTYEKGSGVFNYRASEDYNNLQRGAENTYLITAFDSNDEEIASISFSFFSTKKIEE